MGFRISQFIGTIWSRMTTAHSSGPKGHADVWEMAWILNVTPPIPLPLLFLCLSYPSHDFVIFPIDKTGHVALSTFYTALEINRFSSWKGKERQKKVYKNDHLLQSFDRLKRKLGQDLHLSVLFNFLITFCGWALWVAQFFPNMFLWIIHPSQHVIFMLLCKEKWLDLLPQ